MRLERGYELERGRREADRGAWRLDGLFGGYEGHPFEEGGRDRWIRRVEEQQGY